MVLLHRSWVKRKGKQFFFVASTDQTSNIKHFFFLHYFRAEKLAVAFPAGARCQKCLEYGHWSYECTGKRKFVHRDSRTKTLSKNINEMNEKKNPKNVKVEPLSKKSKQASKQSSSSDDSDDSSDSDSSESDSDDSSDSSDDSSSSSSSSSNSDSESTSDSNWNCIWSVW